MECDTRLVFTTVVVAYLVVMFAVAFWERLRIKGGEGFLVGLAGVLHVFLSVPPSVGVIVFLLPLARLMMSTHALRQ
tara:strand:- start:430 stop:660 length:231 start_codon:yes stop_codon:yes gene_type:complete